MITDLDGTRLDRKLELRYRDELHNAWADVLLDAEAIPEILIAVDRVGAGIAVKGETLEKYQRPLRCPAVKVGPRRWRR